MNKENISLTVATNLCISCGICVGTCPKKCIEWNRKNGMFQPRINDTGCISCGLCKDVCPGIGVSWNDENDINPIEKVTGPNIQTYNAWSLNPDIRHVSASGGVVSTIVSTLLENGQFDKAFCVDTYNYSVQLKSVAVSKEDIKGKIESTNYPKSRYLPISHENAVKYILTHKNEKIILIGTSCAVQGLLGILKQFKLNRDNYLIIGLFCERVFNYNINSYFGQKHFSEDKDLIKFHFKNKESGGWPGNMKLFFKDGTSKYLQNTERMKVKDYFMPERCLYCLDKLNVGADISLGDNYTGIYSSELGSNSVIVRSDRGMDAWNNVKHNLEFYEIDINAIVKAQDMKGRLDNYWYGRIKESIIKDVFDQSVVLNDNLCIIKDTTVDSPNYDEKMNQIIMGAEYETCSEKLMHHLAKLERIKKKKMCFNRSIVVRGFRYLKRKMSKVKK